MRSIAYSCMIVAVIFVSAQNINAEVLAIANSYSGGGYKWAGSGTPKSLFFKKNRLLDKSPQGTYCSGYTFTVAFDAMLKKGLLDDFSFKQVQWLQRNWYGTNKACAETQCVYAMKELGLGSAIAKEEAQAGDFVQFWRNNKSGHSVIFLNWVRDSAGRITGIKYRSTQRATNGIGSREEKMGKGPKDINPNRIYVGRLNSQR